MQISLTFKKVFCTLQHANNTLHTVHNNNIAHSIMYAKPISVHISVFVLSFSSVGSQSGDTW